MTIQSNPTQYLAQDSRSNPKPAGPFLYKTAITPATPINSAPETLIRPAAAPKVGTLFNATLVALAAVVALVSAAVLVPAARVMVLIPVLRLVFIVMVVVRAAAVAVAVRVRIGVLAF